MGLVLNRFAASGEGAYINKHNQNAQAIETAVDGLSEQVSATAGSTLSLSAAFAAMFGVNPSIVGKGSYLPAPSGSTLTVAGGYFWRPSNSTVVRKLTSTVLSFAGVAAGTYYLQVDATGNVTRSDNPAEAAYSVVWTGSAFGTITLLAEIVYGGQEWIDTQASAALGASYYSLDERLEAGEVKAVAGDLSRTYDIGQLSKSVAGSADVALTGIEANNAILRFTGALTGDIDVSVTLPAPRIWLVKNDTTGSFTLTLKGASGTGEVVPQGSVSWAYHDGTNVHVIDLATVGGTQTANTVYSGPTSGSAAAPGFRALVAADLPDAPSIDTSLGSTSGTVVIDLSLIKDGGIVRFTANGNVTALRLSNGTDGKRFTIEITQDATGSRTVALDGTYFKYGTDITSFTATTTASKKDRLGCYCTGATTADLVAVAKGF